jgi:hypothetical protein
MYSDDVKRILLFFFHYIQAHPIFNEHNQRLKSPHFVEQSHGLGSFGERVKKWIEEEQDPAGPSSSASPGGRRETHVKLTDDVKSEILDALQQDPRLTAKWLIGYIELVHGVTLAETTIYHFLHLADDPWTRKRLAYSSTSVDPQTVIEYKNVLERDIASLGFEDEMGIFLGMGYSSGWAPAGERPVFYGPKLEAGSRESECIIHNIHAWTT